MKPQPESARRGQRMRESNEQRSITFDVNAPVGLSGLEIELAAQHRRHVGVVDTDVEVGGPRGAWTDMRRRRLEVDGPGLRMTAAELDGDDAAKMTERRGLTMKERREHGFEELAGREVGAHPTSLTKRSDLGQCDLSFLCVGWGGLSAPTRGDRSQKHQIFLVF